MFNFRLYAAAMLLGAGFSWGHIDSLQLNGMVWGTKTASIQQADSFTVGQVVPITFVVKVAHNGTSISFNLSRDNGTTWEPISSSTAMNAAGSHTYQWTVTGPPASHALIRVFHSASPNPVGGVPNDYTLISGQFSIITASSLRPADLSKNLSFFQTSNSILIGTAGFGSRGLRVELNNVQGVLLREGRLRDSGALAIPTADLSQGRVFIRVWSGDQPLASRAFLIRH